MQVVNERCLELSCAVFLIFYHPRMQRGRVFCRRRVCLSCLGSNSWKPWPRNFTFGIQVHFQNICVEFVY